MKKTIFVYRGLEYDSILEAVDVSYPDNNIYSYQDAIKKHNDKEQDETIHEDDLKVFKTEDFYDFEVSAIKSEDTLLNEFNIEKIFK